MSSYKSNDGDQFGKEEFRKMMRFWNSEIGHERCKGAHYAKCESEKIAARVQRWRSCRSSIQWRRLVWKVEFGELMHFGVRSSDVKGAKE